MISVVFGSILGIITYIIILRNVRRSICNEIFAMVLSLALVFLYAGVFEEVAYRVMDASSSYESVDIYSYDEYAEKIVSGNTLLPVQDIENIKYDVADDEQEYIEVYEYKNQLFFLDGVYYKSILHKIQTNTASSVVKN